MCLRECTACFGVVHWHLSNVVFAYPRKHSEGNYCNSNVGRPTYRQMYKLVTGTHTNAHACMLVCVQVQAGVNKPIPAHAQRNDQTDKKYSHENCTIPRQRCHDGLKLEKKV